MRTPIKHSSESLSKQVKSNAEHKSVADTELDLSLSVEKQPNSYTVSVIMQSQPSTHAWADEVWDARGIVASADVSNQSSDKKNSAEENQVKVIEQGDKKQLIYSGLKIRLFLDECESYYHNLMSPEPGCFIVARYEDDEGNETDKPIPILASLSFDEAHSYLEGDDTVYAVPIPAELYRWAEVYVLENYVAEKRVKRKRVDWKKGDKRNSSSHAPAFEGEKPDGSAINTSVSNASVTNASFSKKGNPDA